MANEVWQAIVLSLGTHARHGSTSKVSDPSPIIILTAMAHPEILNGKTFAGNISNLANENLKILKITGALKKCSFGWHCQCRQFYTKNIYQSENGQPPPSSSGGSTLPTSLCLQWRQLYRRTGSAVYCRQSRERLGECFPWKTKGGGAVRSKSDIYSLVGSVRLTKFVNTKRLRRNGASTACYWEKLFLKMMHPPPPVLDMIVGSPWAEKVPGSMQLRNF